MRFNRIKLPILTTLLASIFIGCTDAVSFSANISERFCLEHTGPEDKPLLGICFLQSSVTSISLSPENYTINVKTSDVADIKELFKSLSKPSCPEKYGTYVSNENSAIYVCKEQMKIFLNRVRQKINLPESTLIDSLLLRL
jgi:hypothetical protein